MTESEQASIELTLKVTYDLHGESPDFLMANLKEMAFHAIGNGMLTGSSDAEVEEYSISARVTDESAKALVSKNDAPHTIEARVFSDDKVFSATFDAVEYFREASTERLRELVDCGFGGDYPADSVADFYIGKNPDVDRVFDYLEKIQDVPSKKDVCGFECYVNEEQAVAWLKENRVDALSSLSIDDWRVFLKKGDHVYWRDPDDEISSGFYQIESINDENGVVSNEDTIVVLSNESGSVCEVLASELQQGPPQKKLCVRP